MSKVPSIYRLPHGLPLYWRDEQSGVLPAAINAYLDNRIDGTSITVEQIALVRAYIEHYIQAPCWENEEFRTEMEHLRSTVVGLDSPEKIGAWIYEALEIGLDPL